jgi:hypothetical protein
VGPDGKAFDLKVIKNTSDWLKFTSRHFPTLTIDHIAAITSLSGGVPGTQLASFLTVVSDLPND